MNLFDFLDDTLNKTKEKIVNTMDDIKDLLDERLKYNKLEEDLQEYFKTDGQKTYDNLTSIEFNNGIYYTVSQNEYFYIP